MASTDLVPVDIVALVEDSGSGNPVVLLRDPQANRVLPIWVGEPEARMIAIAINQTKVPRPLTHQLFLHACNLLGGKLLRIVVDRLQNSTYFATIYFNTNDKEVALDARPSDALAIAVEARVPIFVVRAILDRAGQVNPFPVTPDPTRPKKPLQLKEDEIKHLQQLLKKAREREQHAGE